METGDWINESLPNNLRICRFPKHEGKLWEEVVEEDREYVEWVAIEHKPPVEEPLYEYLMELLEGS